MINRILEQVTYTPKEKQTVTERYFVVVVDLSEEWKEDTTEEKFSTLEEFATFAINERDQMDANKDYCIVDLEEKKRYWISTKQLKQMATVMNIAGLLPEGN